MSYQRFVIISLPRSGNHFLRSTLESHPAVLCQAEPFNSDDHRLPYALQTPVEDVLSGWVYRENLSPQIAWVGFVLQAYHPQEMAAFPGVRTNLLWNEVWTVLEEMKDLHVIHLKRINLLRRHLSHLTSRSTGKWHQWDPEKVSRVSHLAKPGATEIGPRKAAPPILEIDAERLRIDFEDAEKLHQRVARIFCDHPYLEVTYEDLCRDYGGVCRTTLEFLGLKPAVLEPAVSRLETRPLSQAIRNYGELMRTFRDSPWSAFFEEDVAPLAHSGPVA